MRARGVFGMVVGLFAGAALPAAAVAQTSGSLNTYVSPSGTDAEACARSAPCRTFAYAVSQTRSSGEVHVLDSGNYGYVTLSRPVTINGHDNTVRTGDPNVLYAINVNLESISDKVKLRDLRLNGMRSDATYFLSFGVYVTSAGSVTLDDVRIHGFRDHGLTLRPQTGHARAFVRDSTFDDNGTAIQVAPAGNAVARATVRRSDIEDNGNGVKVEYTSTTGFGAARAHVFGSSITDSGIAPVADGVALWAVGARATLRIARNEIYENRVGMKADGGAQIQSGGGNFNFGNTVNGAPTQSVGAPQ